MKYIKRALRDEIAAALVQQHDDWIRFRDKQPPHPARGVHIKRGVADAKIKRLREILAEFAPETLKPRAPKKQS